MQGDEKRDCYHVGQSEAGGRHAGRRATKREDAHPGFGEDAGDPVPSPTDAHESEGGHQVERSRDIHDGDFDWVDAEAGKRVLFGYSEVERDAL